MTKTLQLPLSFIKSLSTRTLFFVTASILVALFVFYVFLVNKTIMNVVARERVVKEMAALSSTTGALEFKYMALKNGVTLDVAHAQGFHDAETTAFLARGKNAALSFAR